MASVVIKFTDHVMPVDATRLSCLHIFLVKFRLLVIAEESVIFKDDIMRFFKRVVRRFGIKFHINWICTERSLSRLS